MIRDEDAQFHPGPPDDPTWAETNYFGFYLPEIPMNVGVYALFRTTLGVVNTTVSMTSSFVDRPWEADYWNAQAHVPIPASHDLTEYQLRTGLSVTCRDPNRVWDVAFDDGEGTSLRFRYTAVMPAFDIHDPEQDPMVAAAAEGSEFAWGTAYNGHFDQSGHFEGELVLRGTTHPIDCISTMDHSWGPRPERVRKPMCWLHAHAAPDLAIHAIMSWEPDDPDGETDLTLAHGYVSSGGEMLGLRHGTGRSKRRGFYARETQLQLTDAAGGTWQLQGEATTSFPWQCWPDMVAFNVLDRWQLEGDGRQLWGDIMDFVGMPVLTEIYSARRHALSS